MNVLTRSEGDQGAASVRPPELASLVRPVAIGIFGVLIIYTMIFWQQRQMLFAGASDFSFLYAAGTIVDSGHGALVYDYATQRRAQQEFIDQVSFRKGPLLYNHAPFELLLYVPLGLLSYKRAVLLWYLLNICGLLAVPLLLRRYVPWVRRELAYAMVVPAFFLPVTAAITQGQDSIVLLLLFTLGFMSFISGHERRAGCLFALTMFKPHLVLPLLLVMLVTRKWRVVRGFVSTGFVLAAVSVVLVGWRATVFFPAYLVHFNRLPVDVAAAYPEKMPNLRGLIYSLLGSHLSSRTTQLIGLLLSAAVILLLLYVFRNRRELSLLDLALVLTVSLLASYHVNVHDLAVLILPFYIVADYLSRERLTAKGIVTAAGLVALFVAPLIGMSALAIAPALIVFVAGLLFYVLVGQVKAPAGFAAVARLEQALRHE